MHFKCYLERALWIKHFELLFVKIGCTVTKLWAFEIHNFIPPFFPKWPPLESVRRPYLNWYNDRSIKVIISHFCFWTKCTIFFWINHKYGHWLVDLKIYIPAKLPENSIWTWSRRPLEPISSKILLKIGHPHIDLDE